MPARQPGASAVLLGCALLALPTLAAGQGSECGGPTANPNIVHVGPEAGSGQVWVTGPEGCTYGVTVEVDGGWLHAGASALNLSGGQTILPFAYDAHPGPDLRSGRITIFDYNGYAGASVYVAQAAPSAQAHGEGPLDEAARDWVEHNETPGPGAALLLGAAGLAAALAARRRG